MRIVFHSLLYTFFLITLPVTVQAAAGPAGHHHDHDHDSKVMKDNDHGDGHPTLMGTENELHKHGAHNWQAPEEEANRPNPIAASAESIATGQQLFRHYCITCHGYNADGNSMRGQNLNPRAANLQEMAGHHSDGDYHYKIRTGRGPMPHWENTISHENIWHLVNYLQSLGSEKASSEGHGQPPHSTSSPAAGTPDHHDHSTHKH